MRMLSRVAENLFWIGRFVERAENTARLLDTARRMAAIPAPDSATNRNEWSSILASSGSDGSFPEDVQDATRAQVFRHLALSPDNPSSIFSCLAQARRNARSTREGLPSDCWRIINDSYLDMKEIPTYEPTGRRLGEVIERTKYACMAIVGAIESTVLRNESYDFLKLGTHTERIDSTARILDVKYFALLPEDENIQGGTDSYQWMTILDTTSTRRVFRKIYGTDLRAVHVVELLMHNPECVRSLKFSVTRMLAHLGSIRNGRQTGPCPALTRAHDLNGLLDEKSAEEVIAAGLHGFLLRFIRENNGLAQAIGEDFHFAVPPPIEAPAEQTQAQNA